MLDNTDKPYCHLSPGRNEVIFTLSKSEYVQIDICTNADKEILDRVERIINSGSSLIDYSPDNDEEQSHTLFSDIYSYLSTSIFGVLFGYVFKYIYQHSYTVIKTVQQTQERCCDSREYGWTSCDPQYVPALCERGTWVCVFVAEVCMWLIMIGCVYGVCCCGFCREKCNC